MNCKQVEELLPLYVGHDLEDERASLIASHVHTCTSCAGSVEEYVEAGQLTQQFMVPQFSEATYASVRQNVLREIEQESGRLTLRELILEAFQPRLTWAVSTAVLLAVCALAYYFVANRANLPHDQQANAEIKLAPAGTAGGSPATVATPSNPPLNLAAPHQLVVRNPGGGFHRQVTNSREPRVNQTAWRRKNAGEPPAVPGAAVPGAAVPGAAVPNAPATIDSSVSSRKPMRLEIQTSDPNIRIIWFSQPSTNEGSPNESSKGI